MLVQKKIFSFPMTLSLYKELKQLQTNNPSVQIRLDSLIHNFFFQTPTCIEKAAKVFTKLPNLQTIGISTPVSSTFISSLSTITCLGALTLTRDSIGADTLQSVSDLTLLQSLHILNCSEITTLAFSRIAALTNLTTLQLLGCDHLTDEALSSFSSLLQLHKLELSEGKKITDIGLLALSGLTQLERICLSHCNQIGAASIFGFDSIVQCIKWTDCGQDTPIIKELPIFSSSLPSKLTHLFLLNCPRIAIQLQSHFHLLRELTTLSLSRVHLLEEGIPLLGQLTSLTHLFLTRCTLSNPSILQELSTLTKLQILDLSSSEITDASLYGFRTFSHLTQLTLCDCKQLTDIALLSLIPLRALRLLKLNGCTQITEKGIFSLSFLSALQTLELLNCPRIHEEGLNIFAETQGFKIKDQTSFTKPYPSARILQRIA